LLLHAADIFRRHATLPARYIFAHWFASFDMLDEFFTTPIADDISRYGLLDIFSSLCLMPPYSLSAFSLSRFLVVCLFSR